jgi:plasmid maintenance system antidote protein VapI
MNLTERLRKAILTSKQSRYAIAIGAGIDHAVLRRFVHGERDITLATAEHLAEYLGLELVSKKAKKRKKKLSDVTSA